MRRPSLLPLLLLLAACAHADPTPDPGPSSATTPSTAEERGEPDPIPGYELASEYSRATVGHVLLIMHEGRVLRLEGQNDFDPAKPHVLASGTKSFWNAVVIAAIQDGHVTGYDELASETLSEWADDPAKKGITIRQLLNFTSGLDPDIGVKMEEVAEVDLFELAVDAKSVAEPGSEWGYSATSHTALGVLLERKLETRGTTLEAYLQAKVLDPIGLEIQDWRRDAKGKLVMPSGARFTAEQWAAYGELIRLGGVTPGGTRVLDAGLLAESFQPSQVPPAGMFYGHGWWLDSYDTYRAKLPEDLVLAGGSGGQMLAVIPSLGLTVVRFGDSPEKGFSEGELLTRLLYDVDLDTRLDILAGPEPAGE